MAVYDRWHRDPTDGDEPCRCGRGRNRLYPSAAHLKGKRWSVQWEDPNAPGRKRLKRNFDLKEGDNPNVHADAFDKLMQAKIIRKDYTDPNAGNVSLREYAETWRKARSHGESAARVLESLLRCHVYEDPARPGTGKTIKGGVSIGQHPMAVLAQRPMIAAGWAAAVPLAEGSRRKAFDAVLAIFDVAADDGTVTRNPLRSKAVDKPGRGGGRAQPYSRAELDGIEAGLDDRYKVIARLGAGTGMRQMEMAALGADDIHTGGPRPRTGVMRQLKAVDGKLHFAPLKNRKPHFVPLAPAVAAALDGHAERFPPVPVTLPWHEPGSKLHGTMVPVRLVLSRPDGTPLTRGSFDSAWRTGAARFLAARALGGKRRRSLARGWNVHRTRHTYASAQLRAGTDLARLAAWLGDTVQEVVRTYLHLMPGDDEADGRAAVEAYFAGDGSGSPDVAPGAPGAAVSQAGPV